MLPVNDSLLRIFTARKNDHSDACFVESNKKKSFLDNNKFVSFKNKTLKEFLAKLYPAKHLVILFNMSLDILSALKSTNRLVCLTIYLYIRLSLCLTV